MPDQMPPQSPDQSQQPVAPPQDTVGQDPQAVHDLIVGINDSLTKLGDALSGVAEIPQELKDSLGELTQEYQGLVKQLAASANGQPPAADAGALPPAQDKKPPMRGPMPMSGGPNAKPVM